MWGGGGGGNNSHSGFWIVLVNFRLVINGIGNPLFVRLCYYYCYTQNCRSTKTRHIVIYCTHSHTDLVETQNA